MRIVRYTVGPAAQLGDGHVHVVKLGDMAGECAVVQHAGAWHAMGALCPHQNASLDGSTVERGAVVCRRHGYRFDVRTGECLTLGGYGIPTFGVEVCNGQVTVLIREFD